MKKIYFVLIVFALLFISGNISGKQNFRGYCVKANGDTVKGVFSGYNQSQFNSGEIKFIPEGSSNTLTLHPSEYSMFSVEKYEKYFSYKGPRMINPITGDGAKKFPDNGSENKFDTITAFLRQVGETTNCVFYSYADQSRVNYYYKFKGEPIKELLFKVYQDNNALKKAEYYKEQLSVLFSGEMEPDYLSKNISKLDYTEEGLVSFIDEINSRNIDSKGNSASSGLVLEAGIAFNSFSVTGVNTFSAVATKYKTSTSPVAGIGYILPLNRNFEKYFLFPQLKVYSFENEGMVNRYQSSISTTYKSDLVILPSVYIGYYFIHTSKLKMYASPGIGVLYMIENKQLEEISFSSGQSGSTETKESNLAFSLNISIGIVLSDKFIVWGNANVPTSTVSEQYYTGYHSSIQTGIGWKF